jgi:hypothetical protein
MSRSKRVLVALPLLLFVAGLFVLIVPSIPPAARYVRDLSGDLLELGQAWRSRQTLRAESRAGLARLETRHEVAGQVAQRRLSLLEGAARFRALDGKEPPVVLARLRMTYPGDTAEERCCRHLIHWVRLWLNDHPRADPRIPARLEAELEEHLRGGTLRLPEPDARRSSLPRST